MSSVSLSLKTKTKTKAWKSAAWANSKSEEVAGSSSLLQPLCYPRQPGTPPHPTVYSMSLQLAIIPGLEQNAARWLSADSRLMLSIDDFDKVTVSNCVCKCHYVRIPATLWINSKCPNEHKAMAFLSLFLISAGNNIQKEFVFFSTITPKGEGRGWCLQVYMIQKEQAGEQGAGTPQGEGNHRQPLSFSGQF